MRAARGTGPAGTVDRQREHWRAPVAGLIEDYALIGDMQTAALVGKDGSIDWLCLPRFDSPACFTRLLGTEDHGYWRIGPAGGPAAVGGQPGPARRYHGDSLILHTEWRTATGTVRVIDFMPPRDGGPPVRCGYGSATARSSPGCAAGTA
jgi:GH15 family glucan-1,4-alpha-glucosidase